MRGFRQGLYADNVQFYTSKIDAFLDEIVESGTPRKLYDHIILDLPGSQAYMAQAAKALKVDGCLLLWVPSITQIIDGLKVVKAKTLPLHIDRVIEVGQGISSGRLWDVRWTRIRDIDRKSGAGRSGSANLQQDTAMDTDCSDADSAVESGHGGEARQDVTSTTAGQAEEPATTDALRTDHGQAIVCRPKVGERTIGGGFIALWRRIREKEE